MKNSWPDNYKEGVRLQEELKSKVIIEPFKGDLKYITGVDISISRRDKLIFCAIVTFSYPSLELIEEATSAIPTPFPYVPGLLSLREGPAIIEAYKNLSIEPHVIIFDGQGIAHPRGLGIASHIGVILDLPTIGCAKSRLVGEYEEPGPGKGDYSILYFEDREVGAVVRTREGTRPVFVSPGHRMDIQSAVDIVLSTCRGYRLPEPVRIAHIRAGELKRRMTGSK